TPRTIQRIASIDPARIVIDTQPRLSPDDRLIAFTAHAADAAPPVARSKPNNELHVLSIDQARDQTAELPPSIKGFAVWTADSRQVLFIDNQSGTSDLWSIDVTGGHIAAAPLLVSANFGDHVGLR